MLASINTTTVLPPKIDKISITYSPEVEDKDIPISWQRAHIRKAVVTVRVIFHVRISRRSA